MTEGEEMPKRPSTQYICKACGESFSKWSGKCTSCGAWSSLEESAPVARLQKTVSPPLKSEKLSGKSGTKLERIGTGVPAVDEVFGGGIVPGSLVLMAGDPGIGKSTLLLQIAHDVAAKRAVLYMSGEESAEQVNLRAERLLKATAGFDFVSSTDADALIATIATGQYELVVVDSIQTMSSAAMENAPGSVAQLTSITHQLMEVAKRNGTAVIIVGHVTKEGVVAGPRVMEHLVDTVMYLEGERSGTFKILRAIKNRFGSINETAILEMSDMGLRAVANPSQALLENFEQAPGNVVLATLEGSRPVLVEVQALVSPTVFGYPKRSAAGIDLNRLNVLVAVAQKRAGLNLSGSDIYVNIVGGLRVLEPAADLAIICAIVSSFKNSSLPRNTVVFGEVGLAGEIRPVGASERRLAEATKLGFTNTVVAARTKDNARLKIGNIKQVLELIKTK
jgi:DNA repair protein RadA/Sms